MRHKTVRFVGPESHVGVRRLAARIGACVALASVLQVAAASDGVRATVGVRVVTRGGAPQAGAEVRVLRSGVGGGRVLATARTDSLGHVELPLVIDANDLASGGGARVVAWARGFAPSAPVELQFSDIGMGGAAGTATVVLLRGSTVLGRVVAPTAGVGTDPWVMIYDAEEVRPRSVLEAQGGFFIGPLVRAVARVEVSSSNGSWLGEARTSDGGVVDLGTLTPVVRSSIRGRVVAPEGSSVEGLVVRALAATSGPPSDGLTLAAANVDSVGRFTIRGLSAGEYVVEVLDRRRELGCTMKCFAAPSPNETICRVGRCTTIRAPEGREGPWSLGRRVGDSVTWINVDGDVALFSVPEFEVRGFGRGWASSWERPIPDGRGAVRLKRTSGGSSAVRVDLEWPSDAEVRFTTLTVGATGRCADIPPPVHVFSVARSILLDLPAGDCCSLSLGGGGILHGDFVLPSRQDLASGVRYLRLPVRVGGYVAFGERVSRSLQSRAAAATLWTPDGRSEEIQTEELTEVSAPPHLGAASRPLLALDRVLEPGAYKLLIQSFLDDSVPSEIHRVVVGPYWVTTVE